MFQYQFALFENDDIKEIPTSKEAGSKIESTSKHNDWTDKSSNNCITGCSHDCLYCYAKAISIGRGWIKSPDEWHDEKVRPFTKPRRYKDMVMFPSMHDITPKHLDVTMERLRLLLNAGNKVLVVSKPYLDCIKIICDEFTEYKGQILFRITIGSANNNVLRFWEPNAPLFEERTEALKYAFDAGYQTSLSCEPMLDNNIHAVISLLSEFVTESIWIGTMNKAVYRLFINGHKGEQINEKVKEILRWQSKENLLKLYESLKDNPLIKWKKDFKVICGLD